MELRSCDATHFIQTISRGLVTKLRNTDSHGNPAIVYKSLKEVYENENATRLQRSGPDLVLDNVQVKLRDFPVVDRILQEIKPETDEFVCYAGRSGSNELDDNTTLKQLRRRFSTKKRKRRQSDENFLLVNVNEGPVEDDLYEPLIKLKSKCSRTSKTKRKCKNSSVLPNVDLPIKTEKNLSSEGDFLQVAGQFDQVIRVKVEVPDTEQLECQNKTSSADDSFMGHNVGLGSGGSSSNEYQEMVECEHQNYVTDEIPYGHLEEAQPMSLLVPSDGVRGQLETLESGCKNSQDPFVIEDGKEIEDAHSFRISMSQDTNSDGCANSGCSGNMNIISEQSSITEDQVSEMTIEGDYPCEQDSFLSGPDTQRGSCSLQIKENVISVEGASTNEKQPLTPAFEYTTKNDLDSEVNIEDETDAFCKDKEKQTLASSISDAESYSPLKNQSCESSERLSSSKHVSPERLLSTRKAMSPSSQERLCMVMNAIELCGDADLCTVPDSKGKFFEKQIRTKASILRSDIQYNKSTDSHTGPEQSSSVKVIISPRVVKRRSKVAKGNLEGPHFSRILPYFSTGCTSIQGCSESAIAFSQRQMQDMESLTEKLMNELKSMKDIVEQKLLFEAYRNNSLKNDADGVKSAINNATKVEDTARKWLSVMSRDCNRFCKIMKMTPNSTSASKDTIRRERKRIVFADDVGGKLCHVKFFGDGDVTNADEVKHRDH